MSKRIVIALGGNALGNTAAQQLELVSLTAKPIVDLIAAGNEVIIAHGNGPQVGMINLGLSTAAEAGAIKSDMPFPECGAMSQGYIGYHLQNAIGNELTARGLRKDVATVVTQVLVDENALPSSTPPSPIGSFYDKVAADRIMAQRGCTMVEDAGRGWRQVVPSPEARGCHREDTVRALVDSGTVVITVGGGGIPVVRRSGRLVGTPAVIDKDFASAKLAELLNLSVGDTLTLECGEKAQAKVTGIVEHYVRHYVYMSAELYTQLFGTDYVPNELMITAKDPADPAVEEMSQRFMEMDSVTAVSNIGAAAHSFEENMKAVNAAVTIIILSAAALALVVLYNLTNINITERIRELATIKVLGFRRREVYRYINKETVILTLVGIVAGLSRWVTPSRARLR